MILIVDDSRQSRQMIRTIIGDLDGDFRECGDGSQALAVYAECRPDWVLMDIAMSKMNGLEATRQIISVFPEAHIAIVTGFDDDDLRKAAKEAGASERILC
jgi:NarL family two-component system response regulator LiaR